ncbi:hypothetical protein HHL19_05985 [Streptomyces sp. R302]|uniref:hypothetical protein n=1 Tax=unclassified Streptomyces TaxID=2593676 RepID=UPI00145D72B4|nr:MULTISPECIES: hypothetical protein [unclassified Streptomyces]NML53272.1 hypothetical protein [Streptomyces sp. R301]NML78226.1 hypothetical protein [Streptomyces sp. R302]
MNPEAVLGWISALAGVGSLGIQGFELWRDKRNNSDRDASEVPGEPTGLLDGDGLDDVADDPGDQQGEMPAE